MHLIYTGRQKLYTGRQKREILVFHNVLRDYDSGLNIAFNTVFAGLMVGTFFIQLQLLLRLVGRVVRFIHSL